MRQDARPAADAQVEVVDEAGQHAARLLSAQQDARQYSACHICSTYFEYMVKTRIKKKKNYAPIMLFKYTHQLN